MSDLQASRRLVKSPPELWAEVSDAGSLARHLGELGEIRITRLEPETAVAWEGERASGTVELAPAGWGTSVTLTAVPVVAEESAAVEPEPAPEAVTIVEPEPASPEPAPAESEPAPIRRSWIASLFRRRTQPAVEAVMSQPEPVAPEPVAEEPAPVAEEPVVAEAPAVDPLETMLTNALDSLGAAHHRPFSRG